MVRNATPEDAAAISGTFRLAVWMRAVGESGIGN